MTVTKPEEQTTSPTIMSKVSGMAASVLQSFHPLKSIHQYLTAVHFYVNQPERQIIAHHYCSHLTEDVRQCLIYDGNSTNSKLIGVEYIISRTQFEALPEDEKAYWHSHNYEVCSGILSMPGLIPDTLEIQEMRKLVDTYGKTWLFWQVDRGDPLPYGPPKLMASFTADGQANSQLVRLMDEGNGGPHIGQRRLYRAQKGLVLDAHRVHQNADKFSSFTEPKAF